MRGEPGLLEGEANGAVRVRDHARREAGRANALQGVDRFGVCPVTEPHGQVEGPPPLGHGALLAGVGDPQRLQQIAHVAPTAGPRASGLGGLLVIEADPRPALGRGHRLLGDGVSARRERGRHGRIVHFQERMACVEEHGAHRHAPSLACRSRAVNRSAAPGSAQSAHSGGATTPPRTCLRQVPSRSMRRVALPLRGAADGCGVGRDAGGGAVLRVRAGLAGVGRRKVAEPPAAEGQGGPTCRRQPRTPHACPALPPSSTPPRRGRE